MDQSPKDQLLQLIERMQMPVTMDEAQEHLKHLSDDEVKNLLIVYQDVYDTEQQIEADAVEANPEKAAKIEEDYQQKIEQAHEQYYDDLEKIQAEEDHELDKLDLEMDKKISDILHKQQADNNELDEAHKELFSKVTTSLLKSSQPPA